MLVLVIEKGGSHVRLLSWGLQEAGYDVLSATDFPTWNDKPAVNPDVIILNSHMASESKTLWVSALRTLVAGVRVIDLTTADVEPTHTGADAYLQAPHKMKDVVSLIAEITNTAPPVGSRLW